MRIAEGQPEKGSGQHSCVEEAAMRIGLPGRTDQVDLKKVDQLSCLVESSISWAACRLLGVLHASGFPELSTSLVQKIGLW